MATVKTPTTLLGEPEEYTGATAQDKVEVHVLGCDQITRENFRVKLQAQAELTGGRDAEGLPLGFFLNGILLGKTAFDDFGVADIALTIDWAALKKGKALTVKVKGMNAAVPIAWDAPKSPMQLDAEERERQERAKAEQQRRDAEERERQERARAEQQRRESEERVRQEKIRLEEQKRQEEERQRQEKIRIENAKRVAEELLKTMIYIPKGTVYIEATDENEKLVNELWVKKICNELRVEVNGFKINEYPVTQAQWQAVMVLNPSRSQNDDRPANVPSYDAENFCKYLNSVSGTYFRLPTKAELELARKTALKPFMNNIVGLSAIAHWLHGLRVVVAR